MRKVSSNCIRLHPNDQPVSTTTSELQQPHVARVQDVKTSGNENGFHAISCTTSIIELDPNEKLP